MKKISLIVGLLVFGAASAQRKDLFDIDAHLQKKIGLKKMLKPTQHQGLNGPINPGAPTTNFFQYYNNSMIQLLPQDNMPCLRPDLRQFNMPNAAAWSEFDMLNKSKNEAGKIPNPASPGKIFPKRTQ